MTTNNVSPSENSTGHKGQPKREKGVTSKKMGNEKSGKVQRAVISISRLSIGQKIALFGILLAFFGVIIGGLIQLSTVAIDYFAQAPLQQTKQWMDVTATRLVRTLDAQDTGTALAATSMAASLTVQPSMTATFTATPTGTATATLTPVPSPSLTATPCAFTYPPRYSFNCGLTGWQKSSLESLSAGIRKITTTTMKGPKFTDTGVLQVDVDFMKTSADRAIGNRQKVDIQVDLMANPPAGIPGPASFKGSTISAWVYAPKDSKGAPGNNNGIQIFVKDDRNRNCYMWTNIDSEEAWFRIIWKEDPSNKGCEQGFDSSHPISLGIEISVPESSPVVYTTPLTFYFDEIDWQEPKP
jgi:hypothetical protein